MLSIEENRNRILILVLFGISLLTRLLFLGGKSLWIDECFAWGAVHQSWINLPSLVASGTPHPPIAFIIMKISSLLAGESEFGLRLLVAVAGASAIIPVFRLTSRRTTIRGGFWAGMVWAVCPFAVSLGQEAWVYGTNAAISLWFTDFADMAWRGSKKGFIGSLVLGAVGLFTQQIFILSIAVSMVLYFTIDERKRISFKRFIIVPAVLVSLYIPIFLYFTAQFAERAARMAAAGFKIGFSRIFSFQPFSQFFRILADGLLPEISRNLLDRPRMLLVYIVNAAVILFLAIWPFFTRMMKPSERKYLWLALLIPFGLYLNDEPTVRQLSVLWVPFSITSAFVFAKYRWFGIAVSSLCLLALIPYYGMKVFPYHRSDWRTAVATVEDLSQPEDLVVVFGGKSTSLAWEYYSDSALDCLTPGGDDPFAGDRERNRVNPELLLDSILTSNNHRDVWVILDCWDATSIQSIKGQHDMDFFLSVSEHMQVALLKSDP